MVVVLNEALESNNLIFGEPSSRVFPSNARRTIPQQIISSEIQSEGLNFFNMIFAGTSKTAYVMKNI